MSKEKFIPIYEPLLNGNESKYLNQCIDTGWISSKGQFVTDFESAFANYIGVPYALTTANGTVALHLALESMEIGPGDEVLVPDLTFAASVNAILYTGATPVLVDVNKHTYNIDFLLAEKLVTPNTKAIMPVHLYGRSANMDLCTELAEKYNLMVIEDAAESFGSEYKQRKTGSMGDVGCFSFFGNKTITTGEGGMITFKDKKLYQKAKTLRDHGMDPEKTYWHNHIGFNYRMTNMQAAIGLAQIERVEEILNKKIEIAEYYKANLKPIPGISFVPDDSNYLNTYWLVTIIVEPSVFGKTRDQVVHTLRNFNIDSRPVFYPIHIMPPYRHLANTDFTNSNFISNNGLSLPSSLNLTTEDIDRVCNTLLNQ